MGAEKYNFRIDGINPNNSHGKVLMNVREGSKVLECGSASGYMTEYLSKQMGCKVSIVEIDKAGFMQSMQFAQAGYRGNLNTLGWYRYYRKELFDFILFADVLEHLYNPLMVLQHAGKLLAPGGKIIISIPNICHNDVIIRMFNDCFTYTKIGLLDDTHIHFWGGNDIALFCDKAGLKIGHMSAVQIPTGYTEQRIPPEMVDEDLKKALEKHTLGEVYQFVIVCERKDEQQ